MGSGQNEVTQRRADEKRDPEDSDDKRRTNRVARNPATEPIWECAEVGDEATPRSD
jgi:hypothetical protein